MDFMTKKRIGIVWFRQDLRLTDNPALQAASRECDIVIPVFIDDPTDQTVSRVGGASRVWLHHSLCELRESLLRTNSDLYFEQGESLPVLERLLKQSGASRIFWNRCYDPVTIARDKKIKEALAVFSPRTFNGLLIHEPWENLKSDGAPYRVYTPYWRAAARQFAQSNDSMATQPVTVQIPPIPAQVASTLSDCKPLSELALLPSKGWGASLMQNWAAGEQAAQRRLDRFLQSGVTGYGEGRNIPGIGGTARISPHLHFGEISPRQVLRQVLQDQSIDSLAEGPLTFVKEIFWREFAYSLIYHFPHTLTEPLDVRFQAFEWEKNTDEHLCAWQQGRTGVPIVDAGMRELYATGWMHNRVRMIVASYLIKNLLIPWQEGERWFRDTLFDADLASNAMGWQWTAGCGADAAPFFRVFNPVLQGEKFDKQGNYVKAWVPELESLAPKQVHKPWELGADFLRTIDYPEPLVDLKQSRQRALDRFSLVKGTNSPA